MKYNEKKLPLTKCMSSVQNQNIDKIDMNFDISIGVECVADFLVFD